MNFGIVELTVAAVLLFFVVGIVVFLEMKRTTQGRKRFDTSTIFLLIGVIWV